MDSYAAADGEMEKCDGDAFSAIEWRCFLFPIKRKS